VAATRKQTGTPFVAGSGRAVVEENLRDAGPEILSVDASARMTLHMTRVTVKVESDHLEKLARPSRRLAGIAEMIWNAVDAEAEVVEVRVLENALQGVDSVEVNDNGHGMTQAEALKAFELLGGSWKRLSDRSRNGKRLLHGSEGQGRWRAFSVGDRIRWITVADENGHRMQTTITGTRQALKELKLERR